MLLDSPASGQALRLALERSHSQRIDSLVVQSLDQLQVGGPVGWIDSQKQSKRARDGKGGNHNIQGKRSRDKAQQSDQLGARDQPDILYQ